MSGSEQYPVHRDQSSTSSGPYRPTETSRLVSKEQVKRCSAGTAGCKDCSEYDDGHRFRMGQGGRCRCGAEMPSEVGSKGPNDQQTVQSADIHSEGEYPESVNNEPAITSFSAPEFSMGAGETPADYIEPTEPEDCGKACRHERAWHFAMLYFTDDTAPDVQIALARRYREALQRMAKHERCSEANRDNTRPP